MMTDQIPLDLAPPPLLNGDVPLMPHMVNGDAVQQVNTHTLVRLQMSNVTGPVRARRPDGRFPLVVGLSWGSCFAAKREEG